MVFLATTFGPEAPDQGHDDFPWPWPFTYIPWKWQFLSARFGKSTHISMISNSATND